MLQYASKALLDTDQNAREMLTVDFACRNFYVFLNDLPFKLVADHRPLEVILSNPRHKTSIWLQQMMVRVLIYGFMSEYRPGQTNI